VALLLPEGREVEAGGPDPEKENSGTGLPDAVACGGLVLARGPEAGGSFVRSCPEVASAADDGCWAAAAAAPDCQKPSGTLTFFNLAESTCGPASLQTEIDETVGSVLRQSTEPNDGEEDLTLTELRVLPEFGPRKVAEGDGEAGGRQVNRRGQQGDLMTLSPTDRMISEPLN
jgi:hypothetical protein